MFIFWSKIAQKSLSVNRAWNHRKCFRAVQNYHENKDKGKFVYKFSKKGNNKKMSSNKFKCIIWNLAKRISKRMNLCSRLSCCKSSIVTVNLVPNLCCSFFGAFRCCSKQTPNEFVLNDLKWSTQAQWKLDSLLN